MLLTTLAARLAAHVPAVDFPKPTPNEEIEAVGASIGGLLLTAGIWIAAASTIISFILLVANRNSQARKNMLIWFLISVFAYAALQSADVIFPAIGDIMVSPFDSLTGN